MSSTCHTQEKGDGLPATAGYDDNRELIIRKRQGDVRAGERLVEQNMGLVGSIARRFAGRGHDLEELFQIGSVGLLKAIENFDLSFEVRFSTYAVPLIVGEIKRFLRDDGPVKVSRSLKELALKARLAAARLSIELGREPTVSELATELGEDAEEIAAAIEATAEVESLSKTIYQSDGTDICLMDRLESGADEEQQLLNRLLVAQLLEALAPEERQLIELRYFEERTQMQVAERLGISQVQVSRREKRILRRLRELLHDNRE